MGHRGIRGLAPENTLLSFQMAYQSTRFFELDTMLCGSGELVVIHDETIDRTTSGKGLVSQLSLKEIQSYDAGSFFSPEFSKAKVPSLREVLTEMPDDSVFDIEVKSYSGENDRESLAKALSILIEELKIESRIFISSFDAKLLQKVKSQNPNLLRGQLLDTSWQEKDWEESEPDLILPNFMSLNAKTMAGFKSMGFLVIPYTVNEKLNWDHLIELGVDGMITDRPDLLKSYLEKFSK